MKTYRLLIIAALMVASCTSETAAGDELLPPSDIAFERKGLDVVRLTWANSGTAGDGVVIERAFEDELPDYKEITRTSAGAIIYQDKTLSADGTYHYRLATFKGTSLSAYAETSFDYEKLPAPTDASCELTSSGIVLSWEDNCVGEEGYIVRRRQGNGSYADWKTLSPDAETVTDAEVVSGTYSYEIYAFAGDDRSEPALVKFDNSKTPVLTVGTPQKSWYMVSVPMTLTDDGGYECEAGICWKSDGTSGATVSDNSWTYPDKLSTGDNCFANAIRLEYGRTYTFRTWVRYDGKVEYYKEVSAQLASEPAALTPSWTDISSQYSMPESIRLYKTSTTVSGNKVNAWYAIADMSAGDLELRTFKTSSLMKPSSTAKGGYVSGDVQIIVNGGFFGSGQSYSYVLNRGAEEAPGVKSVTRKFWDEKKNNVSRTYNVTRGAFGVDRNQKPSVIWLHASKDAAYNTPLPSFNSGPNLTPTATYPDVRYSWDVYSAIGGGPVILDEGRLCFDYLVTKDKGGGGRYIGNPELLDDDIFGPSIRPSRTAIGHTADGKIVIMVVDGRNSGGSVGVTLDELARMMKGVGCTDALNLDGGGSTVMCVSPSASILNVPSDGQERAVMSFVALVKK
ncbi:MAG: phosphodiester glycosidase family protein [Bacteroidales bacterium]|nr:phosphodiester glycosidase family protein [Bacteroidales bacterium]